MKLPLGLLALLLLTAPAAAQDREVQQCVWRCLYGAGNGNAESPAYHSCVDQRCAAQSGPSGASQSDPTRVWQSGRTAAGETFAGIDLPGQSGEAGVYFFCGGGSMRVSVVGLGGGAQPMRFVVDGQAFDIPFSRNGPGGWPELDISNMEPLIAALRAGNRFALQQAGGRTVADLSLRGSNRAFASAISGC